jgi:flagellar basal body rod protein FlgG
MASDISTIQSLKAVDAWIDVINANINGGVRTAFKTSKLRFGGAGASLQRAGTTTSLPLQFPEPALVTASTSLDLTQGAIVASTEDTHAAIQGPGYFMVMDPDGKVLLTRDGEFHRTKGGYLVNSAGLVAVDRAMACSLDTTKYQLNLPAITAADVTPGGPWFRATGYGGQLFYPYVAGTPYDESPTGYTSVTIHARQTFFLNDADYATPGPINLTFNADDRVYVVVNGTYIGTASFGAVTVDIQPYLRRGANTISLKATEGVIGESVSISATIGSVTVSNAAPVRWASQLALGVQQNTVPTPAEIDAMQYTDANDLVVVPGPVSGTELEYTRYGSTVWKWTTPPAVIPIEVSGRNGAGVVLTKSLEASNASMTQSVPELSLAQKLFSALTKVLQTRQTNVDGVLNLVR